MLLTRDMNRAVCYIPLSIWKQQQIQQFPRQPYPLNMAFSSQVLVSKNQLMNDLALPVPLATMLIAEEPYWLGSSHWDTHAESKALAQLLCSLRQTQASHKIKVNGIHYQ